MLVCFARNANRFAAALLFIICIAPSSASLAQESSQLSLDSLDYYLFQAFEAAKAEDRIALNHIGIEVQPAGEGFLVTAALEDYPAHLAGIERGDKILSIDGEPYHPVYSFNDIATASNGRFLNALSSRNLEYERDGARSSVSITPVYENLYDSYRSALLNSVQIFPSGNKNIGYLRLWGISRNTSDLFSLNMLMQEFGETDGLILDLRNSYGYLSERHRDLFIRGSRDYFQSSNATNAHANIVSAATYNRTRPYTKPIAVLINSQTRGGPELLALELAKLGRITTLGERTAGRLGRFERSNDGLNYFAANAILIDGENFETVGVIPEESVPFPFTLSTRSDPQYEFAVELLLGRI